MLPANLSGRRLRQRMKGQAMNIEVPTTEAEADRLREQRDQFQRGADYVRNNHAPNDIDPDLWALQAEACESMVEEMDAALAEFARGAPIP